MWSFLLLQCGLLAHAISTPSDGLNVLTQQGNVKGSLVLPTVRQFLGIPFASANRWEAPQRPPVRGGTFNANAFGNSCIQQLNSTNVAYLKIAIQDQPVVESENCLTANIWSPSLARKQKTAVLVWIYGGAFTFGTSGSAPHHGQNFVRDNDDITVVTFNYRLNIFGQPSAPQLVSKTKSQNFGFLDVQAAIQWVHDNIAAFGGDPDRITIFGQSAGSAYVDLFTFSQPNNTVVKGIIQQSGSVITGLAQFAVQTQTIDPTIWNTISQEVGCGINNNAAQFRCMQAVPFRTLENAVIGTNTYFPPIVDDIIIPADIPTRMATGNFLRAPLLSGSNAQEMDSFIVGDELVAVGTTLHGVTELLSDTLSQKMFICPGSEAVNARVQAGIPTWRYLYEAIFPDLSVRPDLRAFHGSEIPMVFGTYNASTSGIPATPDQIALSHLFQTIWVNFARDPHAGLSKLGLPTYDPTKATLVRLGSVVSPRGVAFGQGAVLDLSCSGEAAEVLGQLASATAQLEALAEQMLTSLNLVL